MIGYLDFLLRFGIWLLLTADWSLPNIIIGLAIALILPGHYSIKSKLQDWVRVFCEIAVAIPVAYIEAIEMVFRPHLYETVTRERVKPNRTPGLIFLDIFLITFTPKTIVVKYDKDGWYEVHRVQRRKPQ